MTIEIGYFFNDVCNATSNSWAGTLFTNIIYTSILLSLIILIIICFTYPAKKNTPMYMTFRLIFYIFIVVMAILAIQERITENRMERKYESKMKNDVMDAIKGGGINGIINDANSVKIMPKYKPVVDEPEQAAPSKPVDELDKYDSEEILDYVLKSEIVEKKQEVQKEHHDQIKVVGASVEDMLNELGV
jgi:hypothetical protein